MKKKEFIAEIDRIISAEQALPEKLAAICASLNRYNASFSWVGFYFMNHQERKLYLGPYHGASTDHHIIPFGKGICGQVANSGHTYIAENVAEESNYIACNVDVKSEIVIPIYDGEKLVAQLDIDSNIIDAFGEEELQVLNELCQKINRHLSTGMHYERFFS